MRAHTFKVFIAASVLALALVGLVLRSHTTERFTPPAGTHSQNPSPGPGARNQSEAAGPGSRAGFFHRLEAVPETASVDAAGLPMEPGVVRQTYLRVDVPLAVLAEDLEDGVTQLSGFTLPTFDGKELEVEITGHESNGIMSGSFAGRVAGKPGSFVFLGYDGPAEAGTVQIPEENYILSITYAGEGLLRIAEMDPHFVPGCGDPLTVPTGG